MSRAPIGNKLLASLTSADYQSLRHLLDPVTLTLGQVVCEAGAPINHVYFPTDCLVSMLSLVDGHSALAVGLVAHEGMVGVSLALGVALSRLIEARRPAA